MDKENVIRTANEMARLCQVNLKEYYAHGDEERLNKATYFNNGAAFLSYLIIKN